MESWGELKAVLVPVLVITLVSTIVVMIVSGRVTQAVIRLEKNTKEGTQMTNMLCESAFFGVVISLLAYELGILLKKNLGFRFSIRC